MLFLVCLIVGINLSESAPSFNKNAPHNEMENSLEKLLSAYYEEYVNKRAEEIQHSKNDDIYEGMQGDQPQIGNNINENLRSFPMNSSSLTILRNNFTEQYLEASRNRSKENFLNFLKNNILEQLGRANTSVPKSNDARLASINMSEIIPKFLPNSTNIYSDDHITEKIRSFYPSCDVPSNTDQELWKDDDIMNLFFNFDYVPTDRNTNIATATLRLYRLPENGTQGNSKDGDCDNFNSTEDEKLLRVSIYWYTKSLKKRRVKKRLSDSKVIPEQSRWVELSVKPATKAWTRGKNLGLGVQVEDQEANILRADRYFKGASCMRLPNQYQPSSLMPPDNQTNYIEFMDYLDEIHRQPYIVTYNCYQL